MNVIKPSLVILTWNRKPSVEASLSKNIERAQYPIHEIVHVDNGSEPGFCDWFQERFKPAVQVRHASNLGVAVGYNHGLALTTGTHVVITGCDRILPNGWLAAWVDAFQKVPNTGVISCHLKKEGVVDRPFRRINGINLTLADPVHARMHSKNLLFDVGFWREDFGLYGYEDVEWADRAMRVTKKLGLANYSLTDLGRCEYLTCEDFPVEVDGKPYWKFKQDTHADPRRKELFLWCKKNNNPYYNPFTRVEANLFGKVKP